MTIPLSRVLRGIFILCNPLQKFRLSEISPVYPGYSQVTDKRIASLLGPSIFETD